MKDKYTVTDLINYYIAKNVRNGVIQTDEEKQNEWNYWQRIRSHQHILVKTEKYDHELSSGCYYALECLGCNLTNRLNQYQDTDDLSLVMASLFEEAMARPSTVLIHDEVEFQEVKANYEVLKDEYKLQDINKDLIINKLRRIKK